VHHKLYHRLWREEGIQRSTPRKQKRASPADNSVRHHQAEHPHQVWAMDFQFDATADRRRLKFLNVIEETAAFAWPSRRECAARKDVESDHVDPQDLCNPGHVLQVWLANPVPYMSLMLRKSLLLGGLAVTPNCSTPSSPGVYE